MLAEKAQTIINRGIANTRMRDFYDIYELVAVVGYSEEIGQKAFIETCKKRNTIFSDEKIISELKEITKSSLMIEQWDMFRKKNYFVGNLEFDQVMESVILIICKIAGLK